MFCNVWTCLRCVALFLLNFALEIAICWNRIEFQTCTRLLNQFRRLIPKTHSHVSSFLFGIPYSLSTPGWLYQYVHICSIYIFACIHVCIHMYMSAAFVCVYIYIYLCVLCSTCTCCIRACFCACVCVCVHLYARIYCHAAGTNVDDPWIICGFWKLYHPYTLIFMGTPLKILHLSPCSVLLGRFAGSVPNRRMRSFVDTMCPIAGY